MWDDERLSSPLESSIWMETIKSSSSSSSSSSYSSSSSSSSTSSSRNHINNLSTRINRSSPSINFIVNSDDEDYTILPPSPPINRTPYSRLKGKARSRSTSRVPIVPLEPTVTSTSTGPISMIQERQSTNHVFTNSHNHNYSGRDYSSFDCYQMDANRNQMVNRNESVNSSECNLLTGGNSMNHRNRENIYEILTSKKLLDTQRTLGSGNLALNGTNLIKSQSKSTQQLTSNKQIDDLDNSIIDANNLTSDALIEREWNKLVNGTCGDSILRPLTPTGKKLIANQTLNLNELRTVKPSQPTKISSSSSSTVSGNTSASKVNRLNGNANHEYNGAFEYESYFEDPKKKGQKNSELKESRSARIVNVINNMNNQLNSLNHSAQSMVHGDERTAVPGTRFKEILKLYENLGKCSVYDSVEGKPVNGNRRVDSPEKESKRASTLTTASGSESNDESVPTSKQHLKSTILQLDSVCQNRLKSIEEFQAKIVSLREEIHSKERVNGELKAERDRLQLKLEEAQTGWKDEVELRRRENEAHREKHRRLHSRLDQLTRELEESHINYDYLEMAYNRLRAEVVGLQEIHSSEINLMKERLNDLTNKLVASERSLKNAKSHIGKLESRKRRSLSMRSPRNSLLSTASGSKSVESINEAHSEGSVNCSSSLGPSMGSHSSPNKASASFIPKDFQHKLQELECKIARIQVILLANEHQSPDEGLPDLESIHTSFPSTLTNNAQQLIEITPPPPSPTAPEPNAAATAAASQPVKVENVPSQITIK